MSLKELFKTVTQGGILIPRLEAFLMKESMRDEAHSHTFISPSALHACMRAQVYRMLGEETTRSPNARLRRIFDNGSGIHAQTQGYLKKEGSLLMDEAPIFNAKLGVMGHTDGIYKVDARTLDILEIKSINTNEFSRLKEPKPEHRLQGNTYLLCVEELRKRINKAKNKVEYSIIMHSILREYREYLETFVSTGKKYTKEQKIKHSLETMSSLLKILYGHLKPIKQVIFYYYDKNTSDHKEFLVDWNDEDISSIKSKCAELNKYKRIKKLPKRAEKATGRSCYLCKNCDYRLTCWKG